MKTEKERNDSPLYYEVFKHEDSNRYYLVSSRSIRYDAIAIDSVSHGVFDMRGSAFNYLEENNIPSARDEDGGYYEIYV